MKKLFVTLTAIGFVLLFATTAGATKGTPHKVTLCHRTDSYTNPYVKITVDVASVLKTEGHDSHNGPIFYPTIPKHTKWGDIIPAFNYGPGEIYAGKNLPAGQTLLDNNCKFPTTTTTTEPTTTTTGGETTTTTSTTTTVPQTTTTVTTVPKTTTTGIVTSTTLLVTVPSTNPPVPPNTPNIHTALPFTGSHSGLFFFGTTLIGLGSALLLSSRKSVK